MGHDSSHKKYERKNERNNESNPAYTDRDAHFTERTRRK